MSKLTHFDIALTQKPLDSGMTKEDVIDLYDMLNEDEAFVIEIQDENSAAMGFITCKAAEKLNYDYETSGLNAFIKNILSDSNNESDDNIYNFNGINIWLTYED